MSACRFNSSSSSGSGRHPGGALKLARARLTRQRDATRLLTRLPDDEDDQEGELAPALETAEVAAVAGEVISEAAAADEASRDGGRLSVSSAPNVDATIVLLETPCLVTVSVRLVTLVCCSQKTVWVFRSSGMPQLGQADLLLVLERIATDTGIPGDVVRLFSGVMSHARAGDRVGDLDHTVFHSAASFLGSAYIGGILYFMDSGGQCFHGLVAAADQSSLLICRLVHSREVPLLMHAPLRLLLRLGHEDGTYPCSVISHRFRPAFFHDSFRSVYSLFRDVLPHRQGLIPRLRDCHISLESNSITVSITRKRHSDLLALLRLYAPDADGVLALGGELCQFADGHLVAMETPPRGGGVGCYGDEYETAVFKAKTAAGKPAVIGASFLALAAHTPGGKSVGVSGNVAAVVEDGVAVTCRRDDMKSLLQSLKCAADCTITADWLFSTQRRKVHTKCPIKFVWRLKPGQ